MVWPYQINARERLLLSRQSTNDRRNIRRVWLWVFNLEGSPVDATYLQTPRHHRKYHDPIPAHFYVEMTQEDEVVEVGVDRKLSFKLTLSRAETYRLATVLSVLRGFDWTEEQYLPRAHDIFQWRGDLFELQDRVVGDRFWGTTQIPTVYGAPAAQVRLDANAPVSPLTVEPAHPVLSFPSELGGEEERPT